MSPDLSQFQRPSDSVTPTKWRGPDGRVWERTGEKCQPKPGEYIWFDTTQPEPYLTPPDSLELQTPIWKLSEHQAWDPGEVKPVGPPSIEELIQQAQFTDDPLILARLQTLGALYQARELAEPAEESEDKWRGVQFALALVQVLLLVGVIVLLLSRH